MEVDGTALRAAREALLARARALAGWTVGELATRFDLEVPTRGARSKGFVGRLLERALEADGGSAARPDFDAIGVELKTVPCTSTGRVVEDTFVTRLDPATLATVPFAASRLHAKLAHVLYVPVEADVRSPSARRIGRAALHSLDARERATLAEDYERIAELVEAEGLGALEAHVGEVVHVRPKAAHGGVRRLVLDGDRLPALTVPRGFYLRRSFVTRWLSSSDARSAEEVARGLLGLTNAAVARARAGGEDADDAAALGSPGATSLA